MNNTKSTQPASILALVAILAGRPNSGINHVINGKGSPVITTRQAVVD